MASMVGRVGKFPQPKGGYLPPRLFVKEPLDPSRGDITAEGENLPVTLMGICVENLTRVQSGTTVEEAFYIGIKGYYEFLECHADPHVFHKWFPEGTPMYDPVDDIQVYIAKLKEAWATQWVDPDTKWRQIVHAAANIAKYDVVFRGGWFTKPLAVLEPNPACAEHIRVMLSLRQNFERKFGRVTGDGISFKGAFTATIASGMGGFVTEDTIWNTHPITGPLKKEHTLLLLVAWIMGCHSTFREIYQSIRYLGVYNPRRNCTYRYPIQEIPLAVIQEVECRVIGYQPGESITTQEWFQGYITSFEKHLAEWETVAQGGYCVRAAERSKNYCIEVGNGAVQYHLEFLPRVGNAQALCERVVRLDGGAGHVSTPEHQIIVTERDDQRRLYHFCARYLNPLEMIDFETRLG